MSGIACLTVTAVASALMAEHSKPRYEGHSLREWLQIAGTCSAARAQATPAILNLGSNAVSTLVAWLAYEPQPWEHRLFSYCPTRLCNTRFGSMFFANFDKGIDAIEAFSILGTNAASAVPQLIALSHDTGHPNAAFRAINALALVGPPAYPHLLQALQDTNHPFRDSVIRCFPILDYHCGGAVCFDALEPVQFDADASMREAATNALRELASDCFTTGSQ